MTDPDLQRLADLWTESDDAAEQEAFEAMARKARWRGRLFAWLDFAAVAFILACSVLGFVMKPGAITMVAAIALIVTTLIVTRKRRQIKQMTRALDTASRQSFIETSISNAGANLRRTRLSLAFFPLGVIFALAYKMSLRAGGRTDLIPATFVEWVQTSRGIITLALLALLFAWGLRTARRTRQELRRLEELRVAYAEEDRQDEDDAH
jgi:preprotein translocase subunit SecG